MHHWRKIVDRTSASITPPEPHLLLRDSRKELKKDNFRRCVLDAATAAEMSLIYLRDQSLEKTDSKIASAVKKKYKNIGMLSEYLKLLDIELPAKINDHVATPRNKAIHEGRHPTETDAQHCLKKAEELVELVFSRKSL